MSTHKNGGSHANVRTNLVWHFCFRTQRRWRRFVVVVVLKMFPTHGNPHRAVGHDLLSCSKIACQSIVFLIIFFLSTQATAAVADVPDVGWNVKRGLITRCWQAVYFHTPSWIAGGDGQIETVQVGLSSSVAKVWNHFHLFSNFLPRTSWRGVAQSCSSSMDDKINGTRHFDGGSQGKLFLPPLRNIHSCVKSPTTC